MANLTTVGVTSGVPSSGTGTVSTIDNLLALGCPISNGSTTNFAALTGAASSATSSMSGLVVSISPNSVNANGQATMANSAPVTIASNQSAVPTSPSAAATGGASNALIFTSSAAVAAGTIKPSSAAGTVYGIHAINISSIPVVLKLYDAISTAVSVGTTAPKYTLPIPAVVTTGSGAIVPFPVGMSFSNAISYAVTANAWSSDATAAVNGGTINVQYL